MSDLQIDGIGLYPYDTLGYYNMPIAGGNYGVVPNYALYNNPYVHGISPYAAQGVSFAESPVHAQSDNVKVAETPKKDNTRTKVVLGLVLTLGASMLCQHAYKIGKNQNTEGAWKCVTKGFGDMYKKAVNSIKNLFGGKSSESVAANSKHGMTDFTNAPAQARPGRQSAAAGAGSAGNLQVDLGNIKEVLKDVKAGKAEFAGKGGYRYVAEVKDGGDLSVVYRQKGKNGPIVEIREPNKLAQIQKTYFEKLYPGINIA